MKYLLLLITLLFLLSCTQENSKEKSSLKPVSEYYPIEKVQVLVVGAFHFDYPGLDAIESQDEDKIDVLKEPKKSEVTELVNYIKRFKPNKIAIEATNNWNATEKLRKYKIGEYQDERDERFQLAMRIAMENNIDTLYSVDTPSMSDDLEKLDSAYIEDLFKDFDFRSDDPYSILTMNWLEEDKKLVPKTNLLKYFKHMNSKESHQYGYGVYLVGDFKLDNQRGADILSIWWYNRNLRIFRKLQQLTENTDDRILVIMGNGHAAVLRQLLESSPEFEFVEFDSL